jgi:hypothetical protein
MRIVGPFFIKFGPKRSFQPTAAIVVKERGKQRTWSEAEILALFT